MFIRSFLAATSWISLSVILRPSSACSPQANIEGTSPLVIGNDGPADPATLGYTLNHLALVVNNIQATRHFYGDILGMRHIFTFHATDSYDITYMGYSQGGKNGTGFQTGEELLRQQKNSQGLIEFLHHRNTSSTFPSSTTSLNTFSHVGLMVPNITQAQARMDQFGVTVLKRLGEDLKPGSEVAQAYGVEGSAEQEMAVTEGIEAIGFAYFLLVSDPDGNIVEIQQQA